MKKVLLILIIGSVHLSLFAQFNPDSLRSVIALQRNDSSHVKALISLGSHYLGKDNIMSIRLFKQAEQIAAAQKLVHYQGIMSVRIALCYTDNPDYDSADHWFRRAALIVAERHNDIPLLLIYYNGVGLYHKRKGNYDEALVYYNKIDSLGDKVDQEGYAGNLLNISTLYARRGDQRTSAQYLFRAIPIFEKFNNEKGMAFCYNNLGSLLRQQSDFTNALIYLKKSLLMKEKSGDTKGIANTLNEMANVYLETRDFDAAMSCVDKAIAGYETLQLKDLQVVAMTTKGRVLKFQDKIEEALAYYKKAKTLAENLPNASNLAFINAEIGRIYDKQKQNGDAIALLKQSITQSEQTENVEALMNAHMFISDAYATNGQFKEALQHFKTFHHLQDSIYGKEVKMQLNDLETSYNIQKKESEIALLKKDQEIIGVQLQRQRAIQTGTIIGVVAVVVIGLLLVNRYRIIINTKRALEIERMRADLARDLHDDIGSTLSSINIVSKLAQGDLAAAITNEYLKKIGDQSSMIMERMSDIVWSMNPQNDALVNVAFKMKEFTAEILEPKNINYTFLGEDTLNGTVLPGEVRKNIFLIYKEAINNAAKYSETDQIDIRFTESLQAITLEVVDHGKGFETECKRTGNGLLNMRSRANLIKGSLEIHSQKGNGTRIKLEVPLRT